MSKVIVNWQVIIDLIPNLASVNCGLILGSIHKWSKYENY
jgi:hypothetical protein